MSPLNPVPDVTVLTRRELEVATLVAQGLSDKEIARRLWLSYKTVRTHLDNIYRKLEIHSRAQLVICVLSNCARRGSAECPLRVASR